MYIKLMLSKQLTINKCTLLDCTNTEIRMYSIPSVHDFGSVNFTHTLLVQTHTHNVSTPCINLLLHKLMNYHLVSVKLKVKELLFRKRIPPPPLFANSIATFQIRNCASP